MDYGLFEQILVLLAAAVVSVALFRRLHLPPILAYLAIGVAVGPHGLGWIPNTPETHFLAEFGVVFLLFTIGLEFSLPQLLAMRGAVLGLGGTQVAISTVSVAFLAWLVGLSPDAAFVVGAALALSSTALVTKQLAEQVELNSRHGRLAVGVLLFQDVAVIPFLVVIAALGGAADGVTWPLLVGLGKGALAVAALLAAGRWLLRPLFHEIAAARSSELFTLAVLLVTLIAAWGTHALGLSMALGAFLAGMMLGETEFRHQIEADIRPFRDVLLGLFFITVGMLLDLHALPDVWYWVAAA
ncbi:MAG: potassium transporter, partial [Gammaproteobacteria bacterium]|nr:potassium transporter [Gammaproteobacteria bacterium]